MILFAKIHSPSDYQYVLTFTAKKYIKMQIMNSIKKILI